MFNFPKSPNSLLDAIEKIHTIAEGSGLNPETLALSKDAVEQLAGHFSCTEQQAVLLAMLLAQHYDNTEPSVRNLIEHADIKASTAVFINQLLRDFVEKGWMKPKQDVRYFPFTEYKLDSRFIHCVTTGDWSPLQKKPIRNSYELLETFGKCLKERRAGDLGYQKLIDTTRELLNAHPDMPLPAFMRERNLNPVDSMLFMSMCYRHYTGNESFDFDTLVGELRPPLCEQFHFRQQLKANEGIFFELELIDRTSANDFFMSDEQYRLTAAAVRSFHPGSVAVSKKIKSNLLELMEPGNIPYRKLFYPEKESTQMEQLFSLMEADKFKAFTSRMQDKGMKAGLTVLLYGVPGTGKTESVLQLARQNGRTVMAADATAIRSKWVGETEKNIKQLFRDYQKTMQQSENIPILLFNEADAILGKRRAVTDRVEQMENTLQNILLQELENFEGIFIATTNMEENLDSAFDRRILYKVRFTPPADEMRLAIWKSKLPDVAEELLQSVNQRFHLTGGQIDNIVKKTEITRLLYPDAPISLTCLSGLAEEELSLRNGQTRSPIGFGRNRNVA